MIDVRDDGTGMMTREAWDIIQSLGGYTEVSRSITGAHVLMKGRIPGDVDGWRIIEDLNKCGYVENYGYSANGRVVGTIWLHIEDTPRHTVPEAQNVIDELVEEYVDEVDQLSDQEQAAAVIELYQSQIRGRPEWE
jgi:primase-polymerase (primpol)-like protein